MSKKDTKKKTEKIEIANNDELTKNLEEMMNEKNCKLPQLIKNDLLSLLVRLEKEIDEITKSKKNNDEMFIEARNYYISLATLGDNIKTIMEKMMPSIHEMYSKHMNEKLGITNDNVENDEPEIKTKKISVHKVPTKITKKETEPKSDSDSSDSDSSSSDSDSDSDSEQKVVAKKPEPKKAVVKKETKPEPKKKITAKKESDTEDKKPKAKTTKGKQTKQESSSESESESESDSEQELKKKPMGKKGGKK
jgi:hypothetical protein